MIQLSPTFFNIGSTNQTFKQSSKQDSFRRILKSSGSIYESSNSHFFRTATGTQSGPNAFDKSRFSYDLLNQRGSYRNSMQFQISSRSEKGNEIPESSRLEF